MPITSFPNRVSAQSEIRWRSCSLFEGGFTLCTSQVFPGLHWTCWVQIYHSNIGSIKKRIWEKPALKLQLSGLFLSLSFLLKLVHSSLYASRETKYGSGSIQNYLSCLIVMSHCAWHSLLLSGIKITISRLSNRLGSPGELKSWMNYIGCI